MSVRLKNGPGERKKKNECPKHFFGTSTTNIYIKCNHAFKAHPMGRRPISRYRGMPSGGIDLNGTCCQSAAAIGHIEYYIAVMKRRTYSADTLNYPTIGERGSFWGAGK
jgi:hypothetical protein